MEAHDGKVLRTCWINFAAATPWKSTHSNSSTVCNPVIDEWIKILIIHSFVSWTTKDITLVSTSGLEIVSLNRTRN